MTKLSFFYASRHALLLAISGLLLNACGRDESRPVLVRSEASLQFIDNSYHSVSLGVEHGCGIRLNGSLWCWGKGMSTEIVKQSATEVPWQVSSEKWSQVSSGGNTCAIKTLDDSLWCFGSSTYVLHGTAATKPCSNERCLPILIDGLRTWKQVSVGRSHSCAIDNNNALYCWGDNRLFQVGVYPASLTTGVSRIEGFNWLSVSAGRSLTIALTQEGRRVEWGTYLAFGAINEGPKSSLPLTEPTLIGNEIWSALHAGSMFSCGMLAQDFFCWGTQAIGPYSPNPVSVPVMIDTGASKLGVGHGALCWIGQDTSLSCRLSRVEVTHFPGGWLDVSIGDTEVCAINTENELHCGKRVNLGYRE